MRNTAAVVVTYNRKELLVQCIEHIQKQSVPVDILIIDNASTDGTADLLLNPQENLYYFNTGANLGGSGGFNYGMKKATEMGYRYIWLMDDDSLPDQYAHEKFLETDKKLNGNYGFLSGKVLWKDGTLCNMNIQKITKWKRLHSFDNNCSIQYASFVSLFLKSETIRQYGLPYKEFFIWSDDWEYTRRISKHNRCYYIPGSIVTHSCNSNVGANIVTAADDRIDRFHYIYRNDVVLFRMDGFEGYLYMFIRNASHIIKILIKSKNKRKKIRIILDAMKKGFSFRPQIETVGGNL